MRRNCHKLTLNKQTIRQLGTTDLSGIAGGGTGTCPLTGTCSNECNTAGCSHLKPCDPPTPTATCDTHG